MNTIPFVLLAAVLVAFLAACAPAATAPSSSSAQATDPVSVIMAFDKALNGKNADAAAALFADDAVINSTSGQTKGQDAIRKFLQALVAQNFQFTVAGDRKVEGNKETHTAKVTTDQINKLGIGPLDAMAEVIVQGGKITSFTVTYTSESLDKLRKATATPTPKP